MRTLNATLAGLMILSHVGGEAACAQESVSDKFTQLQDPMFGISYSYTKVHYEEMPAAVRRICPDYERGTYWVFAHFTRESGEYYVVMGVSPGQTGDSLGAALRVKDSKCYNYDSRRTFTGVVPKGGYSQKGMSSELPGSNVPEVCAPGTGRYPLIDLDCHYVLRSAEEEAVLRGLARDALTRGSRAWGGPDRFKKEACRPSVVLAVANAPIIQQELEKFCNERQ